MELLLRLGLFIPVALYSYMGYRIHRKVLRMNDNIGTTLSNRYGLGGGFFTVLYGWLANAETAILIGVIVTVGGFMMSFYFQRRRHIRERNEHFLRLEVIRKEEERKDEIHKEVIKQYQGASNE